VSGRTCQLLGGHFERNGTVGVALSLYLEL
jgi:hypothetical protein